MKFPLFLFFSLILCLSVGGCAKNDRGSRANSYSGGAKRVIPKPGPWDSSERRRVRTTAYSHKEKEPGAPGKKNAAGTTLRYGRVRSAAADWSRYPLGTQFRIVGKPHLYEIDDYGTALVGTGTIDLYKPTLKLMKEWGVRTVDIQIVKWGSFEDSNRFLSRRTQYPHCRQMYHCLQPQLRKERANRR